jgi:hypothetical protein
MDADVLSSYTEISAAEAKKQAEETLTEKAQEWYELNKGQIFEAIKEEAKEGRFSAKLTAQWDTMEQATRAQSYMTQVLSVGLGYAIYCDHVKDKEYVLRLDWGGQA